MDMNNVNIEEIVKQVLSGMTGNTPAAAPAATTAAPAAGNAIPKTARVAMLHPWSIMTLKSSRFRNLAMMIFL